MRYDEVYVSELEKEIKSLRDKLEIAREALTEISINGRVPGYYRYTGLDTPKIATEALEKLTGQEQR